MSGRSSWLSEEQKAELGRLHAAGVGATAAGRIVGVSNTVARYWGDEAKREASKRSSQAAKERRRHPCPDCGTIVGYDSVRCQSCSHAHQSLVRRAKNPNAWTQERIVAAIQLWAAEHGGVQPTATDFQHTDDPRFPRPTMCYRSRGTVRYEPAFGSWNEAVAAAGFRPLRTGHRLTERDPWGDGTPGPFYLGPHDPTRRTGSHGTPANGEQRTPLEDRGGGQGWPPWTERPREETLVEQMERLGIGV